MNEEFSQVYDILNDIETRKADLDSPILTGTPTAPTATAGTNTTQVATTAFVNAEIAGDRPYATATPLMDGTAAVGASAKVAREDHRHPTDTSRAASSHTHGGGDITSAVANATTAAACSGNAATATKLATARTISLSGDVTGSASFDGSANATITATVADDSHNHTIANVDGLQTALDGKAATSHTHSYLPLSGGTMTGVLYPQNNTSYTTGQARRIILSTGDPSGGGNGDVWIKYIA